MRSILFVALLGALHLTACGDDGTEADRLGVGAQCGVNDDCKLEGQVCLTQFTGGYCGLADCTNDAECPEGSACVIHDDGRNYCFRLCLEKPDCNLNRSAEVEANCTGSITFVDEAREDKACEPSSSGT